MLCLVYKTLIDLRCFLIPELWFGLNLENVLFSEKANFFNVKNELLIEGKVKTKSPEGELQADRLDFNLDSKKLKTSMYNDKKVNIKVNF